VGAITAKNARKRREIIFRDNRATFFPRPLSRQREDLVNRKLEQRYCSCNHSENNDNEAAQMKIVHAVMPVVVNQCHDILPSRILRSGM
jgi:hypothetical protein